MTKRLMAGLALGFGLALTGAAQAQVKLGIGGPITGPNASFGAQIKNGSEQAVEDRKSRRRSATTCRIPSKASRSRTNSSAKA
jgi:hypothetical protein